MPKFFDKEKAGVLHRKGKSLVIKSTLDEAWLELDEHGASLRVFAHYLQRSTAIDIPPSGAYMLGQALIHWAETGELPKE